MAAGKRTMDLTNVKESSQFKKTRFPEGDYEGKIEKVEDVKSGKSGEPMWLYTISIRHNGRVATYPYYCMFEEKLLWKIRAIFGACGILLPKKRLAVDPNRIIGKRIGVTLQDAEYDGKMQSEIQGFMPLSEIANGADDDDEEPDEEVEDAEEEEIEEEEVEEEPEPEPALRRRKAAAAPPTKRRRPTPEPEPEEEEEVEEEEVEEEVEEEEEPAPPPRRPARKTAPAKRAAATSRRRQTQQNEDELEELDIDDI